MMPKDAYYFRHDSNASSDLKLKALRNHYGWEGIGWWWFLVEMLRNEAEYKLPYSSFTFDSLAVDMCCNTQRVKEYIDYCVSIKLLCKNGEYVFSQRLTLDMNKLDDIRKSRQEAGLKSAIARQPLNISSANVEQVLNTGSTSIVEYSREDKSIIEEYPPDIQNLLQELHRLKNWGVDAIDDFEWLKDFLKDYNHIKPTHIRECKDYHSNKKTHDKATWKNRLRNWMKRVPKPPRW